MDRIELLPHAKVNLTLEVGPMMADGYHAIDSIVQVIDLHDRLVIERADVGVIEVSTDAPGVPSGPDNLVFKACAAFFAATGIDGGARCELSKRIPAQAGLGGGSSDAAAAIVGLDRLHGTNLPAEELARIAARVGSDAALFVFGGSVRMRGRGEIVEPLPDGPRLDLVIVKPEAGVSTGWAYSELDKSERPPFGASDKAETAIRAGDRVPLIASLRNDFEQAVLDAFDPIRRVRTLLHELGADAVLLCGSGSAVFGVFATRERAIAVAERIGPDVGSVFVTRTLTRAESEVIA